VDRRKKGCGLCVVFVLYEAITMSYLAQHELDKMVDNIRKRTGFCLKDLETKSLRGE